MTTGPLPMCVFCGRAAVDAFECEAYPDGIPDEIILGGVDHRQPYKGDNGKQFVSIEGRPLPAHVTEDFDKEGQ